MHDAIFHSNISMIQSNTVYLERPHITKLLEKSFKSPLTIIVAGAGYGKTQAVYNFLLKQNATTIWIQLSTYDNIALSLWDKFVYIISLQNKKLSDSLIELGFPETLGAYDRFLTLFSNETKNSTKYFIVYDDLHLIYEPDLLNFFERLISSQIPNLSIIFISRSEPEINTIGLLSKGAISYINEDELLFNENEMSDYFKSQGIDLCAKDTLDIYKYTYGWIFAVRIVGLALKKGPHYSPYALQAAKENIFKLIEQEIFSSVCKKTQRFLISMSLLNDLPHDLVEKISLHNSNILLELSKLSSFLSYDAFTNTYRIHHLLLFFLTEKQSLLSDYEKQNIYSTAAIWYEENGNPTEAVSYYGKAKNYDKIVEILKLFPIILNQEVAFSSYVLNLLNSAPQKEFDQNNSLVMLYIRLLINIRKFDEATLKLSTLRKKYELLEDSEEKNNLLCDIYIYLGHINHINCLFNRKYDFGAINKKAYDYMPLGSKTLSKMNLKLGSYACRVGYPDKGDLDEFANQSKHSYGAKVSNGCGAGGYDLICAEIAFFKNDLNNATLHATKAIVKAQQYDQYHIENMSWFYLLRINIFSGDNAKVTNIINLYKAQVEKQNNSDSYTVFSLVLGWLYCSMRKTNAIAYWIKDCLENKNTFMFDIPSFDLLNYTKYFLANRRYTEALIFIEKNSNNESKYFLFGQIGIEIVRAISLYFTNQKQDALVSLSKAYTLCEPNGLDMFFIEHGSHMRTLVGWALKNEDCTIPKSWLEKIQIKSSSYAKKLTHISAQYNLLNDSKSELESALTNREIEVLTDLCHGLTREEIAINCALSVSTVKSMLPHIYTKLGAVNALDAVRIATLNKLI